MTDDERDVIAANQAFYDAFDARDVAAMEALWSTTAPVACVHPGADPLRDRAAIMRSWRAILRGTGAPRIRAEDVRVALLDHVAVVVCRERLATPAGAPAGALAATNVFVREGGAWRMVHHHAGPVADAPPREPPPAAPRGRPN